MHKRGWVLGALLLVVGAVALVGVRTAGPRSEAPPAPARTATVEPTSRPPVTPQAPRPTGALRIRGTVVDAHGRPVAAVRVSAFLPEPEPAPSERPCASEDSESTGLPGEWQGRHCFDDAASVLLELTGAREGEAPVQAEATTGADGTFTLDGLPEGPLELWALGEHGAAMRPGIPAGTDGVELVLERGVTLEGTVSAEGAPLAGARVTALSVRHAGFLDAFTGPDGHYRLGPLPMGASSLLVSKEGWLPELLSWELEEGPPVTDVTLVRPVPLTGRVLSASGAPAPGVSVHVGPGRKLPGPKSRTVTTDAEGRFALRVRPGKYTLAAQSEGQSALVRVALSSQPSPEAVLELGSGLHVHGQVLDDARQPVAGARVELRSATNHGLWREAATDAEGRYSVGPLEPGIWRFAIQAPRYQDREDLRYTLTRSTGPMDFTVLRVPTVEGRVTDTTGRPLPGLRVQLENFDTFESQASTDAEGRFVLDAPAPGDYHVALTEESYLHEPVAVRAPARDVHLTPRPGASVLGTLLDGRGLPLADFTVTLVGMEPAPAPEWLATTDARGRFSFQGLKPGAYRLVANGLSDGLERKTWREVALREEAPVEVELRFPEERALSGLVVDDGGRPVAGASVRASVPLEDAPEWLQGMGNGTGTPGGVRTDTEGRFTLRHLTARRYLLQAELPGHAFLPARSAGGEAREDAVLASADAVGVRLVMERGPHFTGRLVGPDGAPLTRFRVDGVEYESADGTFTVPVREAAGVDRLMFSAGVLIPRSLEVQGRGGEDVDLGKVRLEQGRTVRIRVLDARTSQPLADALLQFTLSDAASVEPPLDGALRTDADGTFVLHQVSARPNILQVTLRGDAYEPRMVEVAESQRELTLRLEPIATP